MSMAPTDGCSCSCHIPGLRVFHVAPCCDMDEVKTPQCPCRTCLEGTGLLAIERMVLCVECGNKRCPHANDHRNECTGSNDPGQPGSAY